MNRENKITKTNSFACILEQYERTYSDNTICATL